MTPARVGQNTDHVDAARPADRAAVHGDQAADRDRDAAPPADRSAHPPRPTAPAPAGSPPPAPCSAPPAPGRCRSPTVPRRSTRPSGRSRFSSIDHPSIRRRLMTKRRLAIASRGRRSRWAAARRGTGTRLVSPQRDPPRRRNHHLRPRSQRGRQRQHQLSQDQAPQRGVVEALGDPPPGWSFKAKTKRSRSRSRPTMASSAPRSPRSTSPTETPRRGSSPTCR